MFQTYFFWNKAKDLPFSLIKEEDFRQIAAKRGTKNYSRGITILKWVAPAIAQRWASSLIFATTIIIVAAVLRNTLTLRSFQISQDISMNKEAIAFLWFPRSITFLIHQSRTEASNLQLLATSPCRPIHIAISTQTRWENLHWKRICVAVSWTCLQSRQRLQFGQPRRSNRSAVHTLFWIINQAKNLHFGGAQTFPTAAGMMLVECPANCAI